MLHRFKNRKSHFKKGQKRHIFPSDIHVRMQITVRENVQEELQDSKEKLLRAGPPEPETSGQTPATPLLAVPPGGQARGGDGTPPTGQDFYEKYDHFCFQAWGGTGTYRGPGFWRRPAVLAPSQVSSPLRDVPDVTGHTGRRIAVSPSSHSLLTNSP